jgi:hypothetical protein
MDMSKMGNWVLEMQEAALDMTLSQFVEQYGYSQAEVWHDLHFGDDRDCEPRDELMLDGFYGS